jgi:hypothetical protein
METLIITIILLITVIANALTIIDINKQSEMKKQAKLNLSFMVFYLQNYHKIPDDTSFSKEYYATNLNLVGLSFYPYPYKEAFEYTKEEYGTQKCLNAGVVYNLIPEVFSGVSVSEYKFLENQRQKFLDSQTMNNSDWTSVSANDLRSAKVSCVILGSIHKKDIVINNLLQDNWIIKKIFWHSVFPTSVVILELQQDG